MLKQVNTQTLSKDDHHTDHSHNTDNTDKEQPWSIRHGRRVCSPPHNIQIIGVCVHRTRHSATVAQGVDLLKSSFWAGQLKPDY